MLLVLVVYILFSIKPAENLACIIKSMVSSRPMGVVAQISHRRYFKNEVMLTKDEDTDADGNGPADTASLMGR